jgi:hypothetical protein
MGGFERPGSLKTSLNERAEVEGKEEEEVSGKLGGRVESRDKVLACCSESHRVTAAGRPRIRREARCSATV